MVMTSAPALPGRVARSGEVLQLVRSQAATTIAMLSAQMRLARSTVTERVEILTDLGLLVSHVEVAGGRGRPASVLAFNPRAGAVLVAQVGMSGVRVGVSDLGGALLATADADVAVEDGPGAVTSTLRTAFDAVLGSGALTATDVIAVGVGLPGRVELAGASAGWVEHPLGEGPLESSPREAYGVPVVVDRGVGLLSAAEQRAAHPDAGMLLGLKVGTVIECGVVADGRLVGGASGFVGEIGHTPVPGSTALCSCGRIGCLNAVASGGAVAAALRASGRAVGSARELARLARTGDADAVAAVEQAGRTIGVALAGAVNLLGPDVVVLWGYLADSGGHLERGIRESLRDACVPAALEHLRILPAVLGDDAGIRGAATTVVEEILSPRQVDARVQRLVGAI